MKRHILLPGEKIHLIQRRNFEHEPHRRFVGEVEAYEDGLNRSHTDREIKTALVIQISLAAQRQKPDYCQFLQLQGAHSWMG